jgi:transposase
MIEDCAALAQHPHTRRFPLLCIGIDIGKSSHVAGFLSQSLLKQHRRFGACPVLAFSNSRAGFEQLLEAIKSHAPLDQCTVLVEKTGHYGFALEQYLQQHGIALYKIHAGRRQVKRKTDKRDALYLANILYNQLVLGVQSDDSGEIRQIIPPSQTAIKLRTLVQRRAELTSDMTARKNKLTAICDETFPELTEIFVDPNGATALIVRERFPMPVDITIASIDELLTCRTRTRPSRDALLKLQDLARQTIGTCDESRLFGLRLEQTQLIAELRLLQTHIDTIEAEITRIIKDSREGKIIASIPTISDVQAAILLANIGSIGNFERTSKLRGYCGWAPVESQTGTTLDVVKLDRGGNRLLKQTMYLIAWTMIRHDTEFRVIYQRLVPIKCSYDERTQSYRGKNKVIGRICGQIIGVIYALLRHDYDLLAALEPGQKPPEPMLYSREKHQTHRIHGKST